jgi:hypothetical protein
MTMVKNNHQTRNEFRSVSESVPIAVCKAGATENHLPVVPVAKDIKASVPDTQTERCISSASELTALVPGYRIECPKLGGFWAAKRHFEQGVTVTIKSSDLEAADIAELERTDPRYLVVEKTTVEA